MTTAFTIPTDQYCTIRIAVTFIHDESQYGIKVSYMGEIFLVARRDIIEASDKKTLIVELDATVICSTGIASYLVSHQGHDLRCHAQHIRFRRFSQGEIIYHTGTGRQARVLANVAEHDPVSLRWLDGEDDRILPECVESEQERKQRQKPTDGLDVRKAWMEAR